MVTRAWTGKFAIALLAAAAGLARAEDAPNPRPGQRMIESEAKMLLAFAYPTAKRLGQVECDGVRKGFNGGYSLDYTLNYVDSDGDPAYVSLRFSFTAAGKVASGALAPAIVRAAAGSAFATAASAATF